MAAKYSGADVLRIRRANNMTQAELANYMGVARRTVMRWERQGVHWTNYHFDRCRFECLEQPELPL